MKKWISWIVACALLVGMMATSGLSVSAVTYRKGDVNGDSEVTTADVRELLYLIASRADMTDEVYGAADFTGDGVVNTTDAKEILLRAVSNLGVATQVSLLAPTADSWYNPAMRYAWQGSVVSETALTDGGYTFTNNGGNWPRAVYVYDDMLLLPEDAVIEYDLTVSGTSTSINLYTCGSVPFSTDDTVAHTPTLFKLNSYISPTDIDAASDDLLAGDYSGSIPVSALSVGDEHRIDGMIALSAIEVYSVGADGTSVTVNALNVSAIRDPAERDMATDPTEIVRPTLVDTDETAGLETLTGMELYVNGEKSAARTMSTANDNKKIYNTVTSQRVVNYTDGYMIDLPMDMEPDFSLSALRSRFESDTYALTVSVEDKNPYTGSSGWDTYLTEWLNRYIASDEYLTNNNMVYMRDPIVSTSIFSGYTVMLYDITITDGYGSDYQIPMPHYSIAIIRETTDYTSFYLMVLKSMAPTDTVMDRLLRSFTFITPQGTAVNAQQQYELVIPENWSDETLAYYNKLMEQDTVDFGFFTHSMVSFEDSSYDSQYEKITSEYDRISTAVGYEYEIMPTYTHLKWYNSYNDFPSEMAAELAGGNGFNGKPVLQFTYQFTVNNNASLYWRTPMFEILRGDHDTQFRELAQDIKAYGKPVLFRLNNEMNTDWTTYSGIANLLDPDVFVKTWQRLYTIFEEEGVDNCIWIFNPFGMTTPYCNWGEHLCYMPGAEYVQALGLTSYEMGNGTSLESFETMYTDDYEKNSVNFINYPWIISEFAAGAGGEKAYNYSTSSFYNTTLGRNEAKQAAWVTAMFNELGDSSNTYCQNIKGAVWFSANDYVEIDGVYYISNYLALDENADQTLAAFQKGLASQ